MDAHHHGTMPGPAAPELAHHDVVDLAPLSTAAAHAVVTPTNEKAPDAANVEGPVQTETQSPIFEQPGNDGKRFATLRANLALQGFEVHIVSDGATGTAYMVQRWNLHKLLPDQAAVREFAERVGVQHG